MILCAFPPVMVGNEGNFENKDLSCDDHGPMAITMASASIKSLFTVTPKKHVRKLFNKIQSNYINVNILILLLKKKTLLRKVCFYL